MEIVNYHFQLLDTPEAGHARSVHLFEESCIWTLVFRNIKAVLILQRLALTSAHSEVSEKLKMTKYTPDIEQLT